MKIADRDYSSQKFQSARAAYAQQIDADPRSGAAYYGLGRTLAAMNDPRGAAGAFRRAIEFLPSNSREAQNSHTELAYSLLRFSYQPADLEEVEHVGVGLCRADPKSFDGRRLLGALAFRRARVIKDVLPERSNFFLNDAVDEFRIASAVKPDDLESAVGLARASGVKGDLSEAERNFRRALSIDSKRPDLYAELYRVLLLENKLAEAKELLHQGASKASSPSFFWTMIVAQAMATEPNLVNVSIANLAKAALSGAHLFAGDASYRAGDISEAVRQYKVCATEPRFVDACLSRLLQTAMSRDDRTELIRLKGEILLKDPRSVRAQFADVVLKVESNDLSHAESEIESVITHEPDNFQAHYMLSRIQMINGASVQAGQELEKALKLRPGFLSAQVALATLEFALGRYDVAYKQAKILLDAVGGCERVRTLLAASQKARESNDPGQTNISSLQEFGSGRADPAADYLARRNSSAVFGVGGDSSRSQPCPLNLKSGSDPTGTYFPDSLVDTAIETFAALRREGDRWGLAGPVPGAWM